MHFTGKVRTLLRSEDILARPRDFKSLFDGEDVFLVKIGFSVQDWGLVGMVRVRYCFMSVKVLISRSPRKCVGGERAFHAESKMMLLIMYNKKRSLYRQ